MDWHLTNGTATVLAAPDGTASVYLSSGGGFLGGGQRYPELGEAARHAVRLAEGLISEFSKTDSVELPERGSVSFFLTTDEGIYVVLAKEADLRNGQGSFATLGNAMQAIISGYRQWQEKLPKKD